MLKKVIQHQPFRRDIQQTNLPAAAAGHHLLLLLTALRRVQTSRRHAVGQQLIDRSFISEISGETTTVRPPSTCRRRHDHRSPGFERRLDNRRETELLVAEGLVKPA